MNDKPCPFCNGTGKKQENGLKIDHPAAAAAAHPFNVIYVPNANAAGCAPVNLITYTINLAQ